MHRGGSKALRSAEGYKKQSTVPGVPERRLLKGWRLGLTYYGLLYSCGAVKKAETRAKGCSVLVPVSKSS